jgi:alkanesulfonate monooxygenase SsuD/methylene tetrahydromethanopterin reductase-like flavin-dependent oxidoreductase (luciferase family)
MVGSPATVADGLGKFIAQTSADELMIVSHIYDHEQRLESYRIAAEARLTLD